MPRFQAIIAVLALVMVLAPSLCRAHSLPATSVNAVQPVETPCHNSSPATPAAPASNQKCCSVAHYPEALLSSAHVMPVLSAATGPMGNQSSCSLYLQDHSANLARSFSSPPELLPLRI